MFTIKNFNDYVAIDSKGKIYKTSNKDLALVFGDENEAIAFVERHFDSNFISHRVVKY